MQKLTLAGDFSVLFGKCDLMWTEPRLKYRNNDPPLLSSERELNARAGLPRCFYLTLASVYLFFPHLAHFRQLVWTRPTSFFLFVCGLQRGTDCCLPASTSHFARLFFDFFDFDGVLNNTELLALRGGCVFVVGSLLRKLCESELSPKCHQLLPNDFIL